MWEDSQMSRRKRRKRISPKPEQNPPLGLLDAKSELEKLSAGMINEGIKVQIANNNKLSKSEKISIVLAVITLCSVLVSAWSVCEGIKDRALAYKPDILINPIELSFSWDQDGNESWLDSDEDSSAEKVSENETTSKTFNTKIRLQPIKDAFSMSLPISNIGVGSAKNVVFTWDSENTRRLADWLINCDDSKEGFCTIGSGSIVFGYGEDHLVQVDLEKELNLMYMLPADETEESYSIPLPDQYIILLNEIIKTGRFQNDEDDSYPFIFLRITCDDIRDKSVNDKYILLKVKKVHYIKKEDGSGEAVYQLIPAYAE